MLKTVLAMMMAALVAEQSLASQDGTDGVIGSDDRYQITWKNDTSVHQSIGLLEIRYGKDTFMCTGTVVGSRHVLTAAHCLWEKGAMPDEVIFYPGAMANPHKVTPPHGAFRAKTVRVHGNYGYDQSEATDLGMVITEKTLPVKALSVNVSPMTVTLPFYDISITGYPGDKSYGTMWESSGNISLFYIFDSNSHDLDTMPGMSGSTVRIGNEVIGVHSSGVIGSNGKYIKNKAHFLTNSSYNLIRKWLSL